MSLQGYFLLVLASLGMVASFSAYSGDPKEAEDRAKNEPVLLELKLANPSKVSYLEESTLVSNVFEKLLKETGKGLPTGLVVKSRSGFLSLKKFYTVVVLADPHLANELIEWIGRYPEVKNRTYASLSSVGGDQTKLVFDLPQELNQALNSIRYKGIFEQGISLGYDSRADLSIGGKAHQLNYRLVLDPWAILNALEGVRVVKTGKASHLGACERDLL
ncbi:MAG: hypothetical protein AB1540_13825 [Bdellovibrionota bacterium]